MITVDLNCDMGEGFGAYKIGYDRELLDYVTSVNIACGFHAGDPIVMDKTVALAIEKGVAIGAHPGFPDLLGFGRRNMHISPEEAKAYMIYQIGALQGFVKAHGGKLHHVKPHGALYNMAAKDYQLARALVEAVREIDDDLIFMGLANSMMIKTAKEVGIKTAEEVFADRNYQGDGSLVPRNLPDAIIHDDGMCVDRVIKMVKEKSVMTVDQEEIRIKADTICLHGDHPSALLFAEKLHRALLQEGIKLNPIT
ncbi:lactam utilization protein B-like protein [Clostridium aceticum]|uniref:5-oxoprolinase subunit A n=1 Tax=Clostridium aceticum TaxID=84022 RepID=A0A0D8IBQ6_9CLOT|nr:5-oxoprolinase subunit PxpA [Clostridium aceticum]AKL94785.1 lactam utilization protein B-like protein [Clostridium aceticum]KJF27728.1 LamB/YcsF family protein [Clostridium aceticum]